MEPSAVGEASAGGRNCQLTFTVLHYAKIMFSISRAVLPASGSPVVFAVSDTGFASDRSYAHAASGHKELYIGDGTQSALDERCVASMT